LTTSEVLNVPIAEIKIANPRGRSKVTFDQIVASISAIGLKNPITVCRRDVAADGTSYDLVCGQGRLEAFLALGQTEIPALIVDATREDQFLMSLVENIARRPPSELGLLKETKSLVDRGYGLEDVAEKLGLSKQYIRTIMTLLKNGESKLIGLVDSGRMPITVAAQIATGTSDDVQRALTEAYETGDLRGPNLKAARLLIRRRLASQRSGAATKRSKTPLTSRAAAQEYREHTQAQRSLVKRAGVVTERLALAAAACGQIFADENFRTLLRAEGLTLISEKLIEKTRGQ
jgi:ParB family chromosome partitioning protein